MSSSNPRKIDERVSSALVDETKFKELFSDQLSHDKTRDFFIKVIKEYVGQVDFMDKVCAYSDRQIDKRLFNSFKYWGSVIVATALTTIVTTLITLSVAR